MPITTPFISDRVNAKLRNVAERFMTCTCDTKRANSSGDDSYSQPNVTDWDTQPYNLTNQKCGLSPLALGGSTGEAQDRYRSIVINRYRLEFPYGADVLLIDRIYNLRDRDGNLVDPTALHYEAIDRIPDDTSLTIAVEAIH
jgi:hypothetical protein